MNVRELRDVLNDPSIDEDVEVFTTDINYGDRYAEVDIFQVGLMTDSKGVFFKLPGTSQEYCN
jgi:hypothetical protein